MHPATTAPHATRYNQGEPNDQGDLLLGSLVFRSSQGRAQGGSLPKGTVPGGGGGGRDKY